MKNNNGLIFVNTVHSHMHFAGSSTDWSSSAEFDWSQPVSNNKDDELVLRWDDPELEPDEKEEDPPVEMKIDQEEMDEC